MGQEPKRESILILFLTLRERLPFVPRHPHGNHRGTRLPRSDAQAVVLQIAQQLPQLLRRQLPARGATQRDRAKLEEVAQLTGTALEPKVRLLHLSSEAGIISYEFLW